MSDVTGHGRSVFVMAYAFPPASPIGTFRTLRLVKRLSAEGWTPSVLSVTPGTYEPQMPIDEALLKQVPANCTVLHAPVVRPFSGLARVAGKMRRGPARGAGRGGMQGPEAGGRASATPGLLSRLRSAAAEATCIPDKANGWILPAVAVGLAHVLRRRPDALYSSAPPWSGQVAALLLARATGLPWIADFRDPWARAPWREDQPERIRRASVRLERRVIARADAILFATQTNRNEYVAEYGSAVAAKCHVVPNGCDPAEFVDLRTEPEPDRFVLLHAGSLYGARNPTTLFGAIATAIRSGALDRARFRFRLIGATAASMDGPSAAAALGLGDVVEFSPRMPRQEILREMASASCLLVLQPGTTVSVPGKLYEYLAIGRPILSLSEEGETSDLVRASGLGVAVAPHDEPAIVEALTRLVSAGHQVRARPPRHLYDGDVAAGQAVGIIARTAASGRRAGAQANTALGVPK